MLKEKVFKIIGQVMNVPAAEIRESSSPETLKRWDSFQHMNIVLALEEEFGIRFTEEEIFQMASAGIVVEILQEKGVRV